MRGLLALALAAAVSSGSQSRAGPSPDGAGAADRPDGVVRLDAVVTDARGRPVRDLKADDFAVVEDGAVDEVEGIQFVAADGTSAGGAIADVSSRADEETEARRDGVRLFALYLDEYHVASGAETDRVRDLATRVIQNLGPGDLAVVVKPLDSLLSIRLTHNRSELLDAVRTFEGRMGEYAPKNAFEQNYIAAAPVRVEAVRSQIVTSALDVLATHLGIIGSGRKSIVVVSEGYARAPRRRDEALPTIDLVTRTANRASVSIDVVDPRALDPAPAPDGADTADGGGTGDETLRALAADTDGRAVFAAGDPATFVQQIFADASAYYMIAFRPAHPSDARTFHRVELRTKRADLAIHARPGYWSSSPDEVMRARAATIAVTQKPPEPMRHQSLLIRPWFGLARAPGGSAADGSSGDGGTMLVSFVWEAVPPVPGDRRRGPLPTIVSVKATKATDGATVFEGEVRASSALVEAAQDTPARAVFETPPGRLLVQIAVEDADERVLDTDVRDVIVGGLKGPVEVGTPEVLRARNAREFRALESNPDAVPSAAREFSRVERLLIRVPVYGSDSSLLVSAKLSNRSGGAMRDLAIVPMAGGNLYQVDLPLAGLASGEYAVELGAAGAAGTAKEVVNFRVTP
jgi:VWFA-related protein